MYGGRDVPPSATAGTGGDASKTTFAADTWTWDGSDWTEQHPAHRPVLFVPSAAYDYGRSEVVLLGAGPNAMETWTYNGVDWTAHPAAQGKPDPIRVQGRLSFDPTSKTIVTFGGLNQSAADLSVVWQWDGQTWSQTPVTGPPAHRAVSNMAPVLDRSIMLLYDSDGSGAQAGTWLWDGRAFLQVQPSHQPALPALACAADPPRERVLLFGWTWPDMVFQVWSWSGGDWSLVVI